MNEKQINSIKAFNSSVSQYEKTISKLENYNHTYDFLLNIIEDESQVLDLACGPGNISSYLCAQKNLHITGYDLSEEMLRAAEHKLPHGKFYNKSIIDFTEKQIYDVVVNGFGLPFLDESQMIESIQSSYKVLKSNGIFFLSFMKGEGSCLEKPSFNKEAEILFYYHKEESVITILNDVGFSILKKWNLEYLENDGSVTTDLVIICKKTH